MSGGNLSKAKISRIHGGSIKASTVQEMIKASYNNNQGYDTIGEYNKDKSLSNNEVLCYYTLPPRTDPQAVAVFRGTEGTLTDWSNNAKYAVGAYETTDRYKRATDAFNRIIAKYGRANTSLIGHSQSAVITRKLGQGAKEVINLNGANLGEKSLDNEYNVRSSTDVVSQVKPVSDIYHKVEDKKNNALKSVANVFLPKKSKFEMAKDTSKQNTTIAGGYNPVVEHMPGIIDRIDPDKMIGINNVNGKGIQGHNESVITSGQVIRTPLPEHIMEAINGATAGMLRERLKTTSYDNLYHLRIDFTTAEGVITIEKNYGSIDILHNDTRDLTSQSQRMNIGSIPQGLTIGQVLDNTRKAMGSYYTAYNSLTNNCQDFIIALLKANHIGANVSSFVKQDLYELIAPELKTIAKEGVKKVINEGIKQVNETEQGKELVGKFEEHINKLQGEGIIKLKHNKEMINKISNIKMPYRKYQKEDSDSGSDSESDNEMHGTGVRHEEEIIRKLDNLADRIHEHQKIHGGKIHIAKAFKDMGSKIKKGFNEDVNMVKSDAKAAGHYITSKNGLADDLTNYAIPATLGAIGGVAGEIVGGPAGGVAGSMLGTYAGDKLAGQIDKSGHMDTRGDNMKAVGGRIGRGLLDRLTLDDMEKVKKLDRELELRSSHHKRNLKAIEKAEIARRKREMKEAIKQQKAEEKEAKKHGRGILKKISKKITIRPQVGVDAHGNVSVAPNIGYKVGDKMEISKDGLHYNVLDKGVGYNTGSGFSPTKMVNRGIMLSKKGGPVGGLARGAYLDAHGRGISNEQLKYGYLGDKYVNSKANKDYDGDVYKGSGDEFHGGKNVPDLGRYAVSGAKAIGKMLSGKPIRGRGRPKKIQDGGDLVHIDIGSHNESVKGGLIRKDMSATVMPPDAISQDAIRPIGMPKPRGMGFKKGSQEAKDHMARIRAMRKK